MARGRRDKDTATLTDVPRERRLATDEARSRLYELVNRMSRLRQGQASLLKRAIEVGPRGKGGALLIPSADVEATLKRIAEQDDEIEALQDEIEDLSLVQLVGDRLETPQEDLISIEEVAGRVGRAHLVKDQ